ncbi:MAG: hypothetical protein QOF76_2975 [Solirubrobacteraceae bacterium]|jgi:hypothetical protein|nr:hypothetical protein [Solirubrobacteraceae bacterium]
MSDAYEAAIDALYAATPEEFVAERKRLVAELRAAGDRDGAKALAATTKPSAPAWALNRVARVAPAELATWLEATTELRDASSRSAEVGGDALRAAMSAHRRATSHLRGVVREQAGRPLSEPMLDRVAALLQTATGDPAAAEALRVGRLTEKLGKGPAPIPDTPPPEPTPDAPKVDPAVAARRARIAALEAQAKDLLEDVARLDAERGQASRAAQDADARAEEARRRLRRAESEASAAHTTLTGAESALASAEDELRALRDELRDA